MDRLIQIGKVNRVIFLGNLLWNDRDENKEVNNKVLTTFLEFFNRHSGQIFKVYDNCREFANVDLDEELKMQWYESLPYAIMLNGKYLLVSKYVPNNLIDTQGCFLNPSEEPTDTQRFNIYVKNYRFAYGMSDEAKANYVRENKLDGLSSEMVIKKAMDRCDRYASGEGYECKNDSDRKLITIFGHDFYINRRVYACYEGTYYSYYFCKFVGSEDTYRGLWLDLNSGKLGVAFIGKMDEFDSKKDLLQLGCPMTELACFVTEEGISDRLPKLM